MEVYIVVKETKEKTNPIPFRTNECVCETEQAAKLYIKNRKILKDWDDRGATFSIEPWHVLSS